MIDGRTVYTPLYSGVFWESQHVLLEDVDRIEVVSGPGGTLWGSNAVNGVINIVTKGADETQGTFVSMGGGTYFQNFVMARVGEKMGPKAFFRVYGQNLNRNPTLFADGEEAKNSSGLFQGGFRLDWDPTDIDRITWQGDGYRGTFGETATGKAEVTGQNLLGRWSHTFSPESEGQIQVYFDRTWRNNTLGTGIAFSDEMKTYDIDLHHRFALGKRNNILWGLGYRFMQDTVGNIAVLAFLPAQKNMHRFNAFIQDEILLLRSLKLTLGSKIEHEGYSHRNRESLSDFKLHSSISGLNLQPSSRLAWTPNQNHTVWGAISRAVRTPSRIDVELYSPNPPAPPGIPKFAGSPNFGSEELLAYELGYRIQPMETFSLSLATFYNQYDYLRSAELPYLAEGDLTIEFRNGLRGYSRGIELSARYHPFDWWTLQGGYTHFEKELKEKAGHTDFTDPRGEWNDPEFQVTFLSMVNLPAGIQLNVNGRYVDELPKPSIPARFAYDAGVTWVYGKLAFSVVGRNLADDQDPEFAIKDRVIQEIPRSVYGNVTWRL
jgi:iron complex outermembrane receptor protein